MHNLAIIGAGPAGYVAAERAGAKGLSVVLFEKKELGGVCLNEGCMPTKTLLYSAKIYDTARHGDKYGITAPGVTFDFAKIMERKNKIVRKLIAGVGAKMKAHKVEVVKGRAMITGRGADGIAIECAGKQYKAANLLICTGSETSVPPIPGIDKTSGTGCQPVDGAAANVARAASSCDSSDAGSSGTSGTGCQPVDGAAASSGAILTHREILALKERPKSLVIIGGGVSGMEFASFFNSLGTEVTVIEMLPEILGGLDAEISAMLREIYAKKGVKFHLSSKVTKITGNQVTFTASSAATGSTGVPPADEGRPDPRPIENRSEAEGRHSAKSKIENSSAPSPPQHTITTDKILISGGRKPVITGFGLETLGVLIERGGIKVDNRMRTNIPGVHAAGDVTGFSMLAHTASREGEVVVNNLTGGNDIMRYSAIPSVVYTNPEVACVGLTLDAAKSKGIAARELKLPMAYAGRFIAENEGGAGLCKVIVGEKHGQVLGVHMIGNPASEIIHSACMAIEAELTVKELQEVIFPHPTVSEIIKEAVFTL
jgi:dihydrolipoamide dehydrogenase